MTEFMPAALWVVTNHRDHERFTTLDREEIRADLIRMEYMDAHGEPTAVGKEAIQVWANYPRREDR